MAKNTSKTISKKPIPPEFNERLTSKSIDSSVFAVKIRNMSFSVSQRSCGIFCKQIEILKHINMSFPMSTIYGLLGPSGCGKTTLLKLILGTKEPNSGEIKINGRNPSDKRNKIPGYGVGFQPQETALYEEFTIPEILQYFAKVYGMNSEDIKTRTAFLVDFLKLPKPNRSIKQLSGGEQRRVSLAIAIVHSPPLLILDEPTVGVDPLLRQKIWDYLVNLAKVEKTSILITTHYVEEARKAHVVGLMRSGELLVEQTPDSLLTHFKVNTLEKVFLKVCQNRDNKSNKQVLPKSFPKETDEKTIGRETKFSLRLKEQKQRLRPSLGKRLITLTTKNYTRIRRNVLILIFQVINPTLSLVLFLLCVGNFPYNLKVGVYNREVLESPDPLSESLPTKCENLTNIIYPEPNMSSMFLKELNKTFINQKSYSSEKKANEALELGDTFGTLDIDKNFGINICKKALVDPYYNQTVGSIKFKGDFSDYTIINTILNELWKGHNLFLIRALEKFKKSIEESYNETISISVDGIKLLVQDSEPVYGGETISFRDFATPAMALAVVFLLALALTTLSFVAEKVDGVMERAILAGVTVCEILIAQILIQIVILVCQVIILGLILFLCFDIRNKGSYLLIFLIVMSQGIMGMTCGTLISIVASDGQSALMIAFGLFFPFLLLSGVFWPIQGMAYEGLRMVSQYLPQTKAVIALRNVMLKGWDIQRMGVWLGFVSTFIWILVFSITSFIVSLKT